MNWLNQLKRDFKVNKEGLIGGAIVGIVVATYIKMTGMPLNFYQAAQGFLFDRAFSMAPQTQEIWILYITSILVCASIGYLLDRFIKPLV